MSRSEYARDVWNDFLTFFIPGGNPICRVP